MNTPINAQRIAAWPSAIAVAAAILAYSFIAGAQINPSPPAHLNGNATSDSGSDAAPCLATDGAGNWAAVWTSAEDISGSGADFDIFLARSADNGVSWTLPALLNTNGTKDSNADFAPHIATDGAGNWVAVWQSSEDLSGAGTDRDIFVARSSDNGAAWFAPAVLNSNAATDSGDDVAPRIATDGAGNWVAVW
jgi:hypothetical protein